MTVRNWALRILGAIRIGDTMSGKTSLFPYAMFGAALAFAAASLMGPEVGRIGVPVSLVFTSLGWFALKTERRLGELSAALYASKAAVRDDAGRREE